MSEENIYQQIDRQTELLEQIAVQTKKTQRYILWLKVFGIIKLLIIIAPIILTIIYLQPFIKKALEKYHEVLPVLQETIEELSNK